MDHGSSDHGDTLLFWLDGPCVLSYHWRPVHRWAMYSLMFALILAHLENSGVFLSPSDINPKHPNCCRFTTENRPVTVRFQSFDWGCGPASENHRKEHQRGLEKLRPADPKPPGPEHCFPVRTGVPLLQ